MSKKTLLFTGLLLVLLALFACTSAPPVVVFVTPTPVGDVAATSTTVPVVVQPTGVAALVTPAPSNSPPPPVQPAASATATQPSIVISTPTVPAAPGSTQGPQSQITIVTQIVLPSVTPTPTITSTPTITNTPTITTTPTPFTPTDTPTPTISPTPLPPVDAAEVGIQIHPLITMDEWNDMLRRAQALGVTWIKVQFPWREMEQDGPSTQSEIWRQMELQVQAAHSMGFEVLVSVAKAPDWSRPNTDESGPPTDPQQMARFVVSFLNVMGDAVTAVEVWNEPNLQREWNTTGVPMGGAEYMRYFDAVYRAIADWNATNTRYVDPATGQPHRVRVVTAGLAPVGDLEGTIDDRRFLAQMYEAGLANYPDVGIGIHPYGWGNDPQYYCCDPVSDRSWDDDPRFFFRENIEAYHRITRQYGHNAELWITEMGWATYDGFGGLQPPQGFFSYVNEFLQATYTIRALDIVQNSGQYDYVGPFILWNLNYATIDGAVARQEEQAGYSFLRPDYSERPVYWILRDALTRP
ncbi:MAG: hypothetical protein JW910_11100 [Anaerolineae bacterium]|nr:hypothetical protein [Anaerolineae bacterium]